jgi:hypothetical protein
MLRSAATVALLLLALSSLPAGSATRYASVHHPTSTKSPVAQQCFDRGLTLFYAYSRLASQRAFECAAKADPGFAMAYWGIALAHGSNINFSVDAAGQKAAYAAIRRALALQRNASIPEQAYIDALATRYSNAPHPDLRALALAYAQSMRSLAAKYDDDADAATLYAESRMELRAWRWYTPAGEPAPGTKDILATLTSVLSREPMHIGANHFYIHMTEASRHPERALTSAERIRKMNFEPAAAHLVHMPAHTYMRTGDFASAAEVNEHASMHDVEYRHYAHESDPEASIYHAHNLTMLAAAYGNEGRWSDAKRVAGLLRADGAHVPAMFVYLRFNRWNDILAMRAPPSDPNEPMRTGMWHFTRGMALAGTGQSEAAQAELAKMRESQKRVKLSAHAGWYNSSNAIFGIASHVLAAKIGAARGQFASQVSHLRTAADMQDNLLYIEPPDWYAPVRESLGAALINAGAYREAAQTFREDLVRNPRNPRSLFGLAESLNALADPAGESSARRQFVTAWKNADTQLALTDL